MGNESTSSNWRFERITFPEDYTQEQIIEDLLQIPDDNESGFFIECDLEPSEDIKEKTENFPFCPYKTKADPELFSSYINSILPKNYKPTTKLMCDVKNKNKYMIHYRMFKFYINSGMKITKIHTLYRFKQSPWLATYINKNTQNRSDSKTNFEKDLYKLMNNAFFGKTMENVRDRINLDFISHTQIERIEKRQSKLSFKGIENHYSTFSIYKFEKETTVFDKPIYLGFTVLELSKLLMYEFYYNTLKPYWNDKMKLHYMDTDSFILSFDSTFDELTNFLQENKNEFDFSELDKNNKLYSTINKKVVGKMKIETSPILTLDNFIALRSKSYCYSYDNIEKGRQKGIQKTPDNEDYINTLFLSKTTNSTNYSIKSNHHQLTVEKQTKLALNPFDDKRMYLNPIKSLPWDIHRQTSECTCILCIKFIRFYYDEISNDLSEEETQSKICFYKEKLSHQELLQLVSDRAHLL